MKKIFLLGFIQLMMLYTAQEKEFNIYQNSFTDIKGMRKEAIYKKTLEWISKNYVSSNDAIKSKVQNDFIRFEGQDNIYCTIGEYSKTKYCYPTKYQIEISIKDGRYKFDIISIKLLTSNIGWNTVYQFENGLGDTNPENIELVKQMPIYFNILNESLKNYILGIKSNKDEW